MTKPCPPDLEAFKHEPADYEAITAYKAFDADLRCRGFQYEVGKTYTLDGDPVICQRGFHACENPFDVFSHYPLGSRVARVTASGTIDREKGGDSKICAASLTVEVELTMPEVVKAAVAWIVKAAKGNVGTGNWGHAAATGYYSHAAATGYNSHAAATGYNSHAAATGDCGHAAATGYNSHAAATGDWGHAAATGDCGHAAATGDCGHAAVSGHAAVATSPGIEGTARAEVGGAISLAAYRWNDKDGRYDLAAARSSLVGENGIEAGKTYRLSEAGEFEVVS